MFRFVAIRSPPPSGCLIHIHQIFEQIDHAQKVVRVCSSHNPTHVSKEEKKQIGHQKTQILPFGSPPSVICFSFLNSLSLCHSAPALSFFGFGFVSIEQSEI